MPVGLILAIALLIVLGVGIWLTFSLLGLAVTMLIATVVGWIADRIVPGRLPHGWIGAMLAGLLGSLIGSLLLGRVGPVIARIPILPALFGAVIVAFVVEIVLKRNATKREQTNRST